MKRDCQKFLKLQSSESFMALAGAYDEDELKCLNVLISTTNRSVCRWCLDQNCDGTDCGEELPAMASAKEKFFSDGCYEQVMICLLYTSDAADE